MLAERKAGMVNLVDAAQGVVNGYYTLSQGGKMSEADAQREALARLATMRYGDSGYLFVMDSKPVVLMHPTLPQMVGKPVGDFKDPDGKLLYVRSSMQRRRAGAASRSIADVCRTAKRRCPKSATWCASHRGTGTSRAACSSRTSTRSTTKRCWATWRSCW